MASFEKRGKKWRVVVSAVEGANLSNYNPIYITIL